MLKYANQYYYNCFCFWGARVAFGVREREAREGKKEKKIRIFCSFLPSRSALAHPKTRSSIPKAPVVQTTDFMTLKGQCHRFLESL